MVASVRRWAKALLYQHHPNIAARFEEVSKAGDGFAPWFGAWHQMTVNFAGSGGRSVKTKPHVDAKNPAIAFCAVIAFGQYLG